MNYEKFLDLKYCNYIKGIAALCVMLSHYTQEPSVFVNGFKIINFFFPGNLWVAVFFFYSGYGLSYSYIHKENYLDSFISKKTFNIYIPFAIASFSHTFLLGIINKSINWIDLLLCCIGIKLTNGVLWYVVELLVICLLFYADKKIFKGKDTVVLWLSIYAIFMIFSFINDIGTHWYISTFAVLLGMFYKKYEKYVLIILSRVSQFMFNCLIITSFLLIYIIKCIISFNQISILSIKHTYIITALNIILAPLFVLFISVITSLIKNKNKKNIVLTFLGSITYEIYLWHMFTFLLSSVIIHNYYSQIGISIVSTILLSYCISTAKNVLKSKRPIHSKLK